MESCPAENGGPENNEADNSSYARIIEYLEVLVNMRSKFIRTLIVYRPPGGEKIGLFSSKFFNEFLMCLDYSITARGDLINMGGFSIHCVQQDCPDAQELGKIIFVCNLNQHVFHVTHHKGHMFNLVMSRADELDVTKLSHHEPIISDLSVISFLLPFLNLKSSAQNGSF